MRCMWRIKSRSTSYTFIFNFIPFHNFTYLLQSLKNFIDRNSFFFFIQLLSFSFSLLLPFMYTIIHSSELFTWSFIVLWNSQYKNFFFFSSRFLRRWQHTTCIILNLFFSFLRLSIWVQFSKQHVYIQHKVHKEVFNPPIVFVIYIIFWNANELYSHMYMYVYLRMNWC